MQKLIKDGQVVTSDWQLLEGDDINTADVEAGKSIVPFTFWQENKASLPENIGFWLDSDADISALTNNDIANIPVIAVSFPVFADGRGFSLARIVKEQLEFTGELRAVGAYIQDQMFYLKRCGVNAFALNDDADTESMATSLNDFSDSYQAACDEPRPLFRRRNA